MGEVEFIFEERKKVLDKRKKTISNAIKIKSTKRTLVNTQDLDFVHGTR